MSWLNQQLDQMLCLHPSAPVTANVRIFRPTRRSFLYELAGWILGQLGALFFLLLILFGSPMVEAFAWTGWVWPLELAIQWTAWVDRMIRAFVPEALHILIVMLGVITFVSQLLLTLARIWASHRYTWMIVGDEGLRIRRGWLSIHDVTMRYAAIQQVRLRQGPLQRLFGIGDIEIGSAASNQNIEEGTSRTARMRNIAHPIELRDLVRNRTEAARYLHAPPHKVDTQAAAAELLHAARELRAVVEQADTSKLTT